MLLCGRTNVPHQCCCYCCYCCHAGMFGAQPAVASFLDLEAVEGRLCPLTQEPRLLAETLIVISFLPRHLRPVVAVFVRDKPPA